MVIFHSYVKLPEGISIFLIHITLEEPLQLYNRWLKPTPRLSSSISVHHIPTVEKAVNQVRIICW